MNPEHEIKALEARLVEAMKTNNVAELETLLSDDLIFTGYTGQHFTKAMDIEAHSSGELEIYSIDTSEQVIKIFDDVAVVSVKKEISGNFFGDVSVGIYRYTRIWKQYNGTWQVIAAHASRIVH